MMSEEDDEEDDAFLATKPGRTRPADSEEAPERQQAKEDTIKMRTRSWRAMVNRVGGVWVLILLSKEKMFGC